MLIGAYKLTTECASQPPRVALWAFNPDGIVWVEADEVEVINRDDAERERNDSPDDFTFPAENPPCVRMKIDGVAVRCLGTVQHFLEVVNRFEARTSEVE